MRLETALKGIGVVAVGVGAAVAVGRSRFDRVTADLTDELAANADARTERSISGNGPVADDGSVAGGDSIADDGSVTGDDSIAELDEGELLRYLAETVWFPTALVPGEGVEWEEIDDRSARATIEHDGTSASAVFHFEEGVVERIVAERPRETDHGSFERTSWTGYLWEYQIRGGLLVPTEGEVEWNLPDGDLPYWRATIADIKYLPKT